MSRHTGPCAGRVPGRACFWNISSKTGQGTRACVLGHTGVWLPSLLPVLQQTRACGIGGESTRACVTRAHGRVSGFSDAHGQHARPCPMQKRGRTGVPPGHTVVCLTQKLQMASGNPEIPTPALPHSKSSNIHKLYCY